MGLDKSRDIWDNICAWRVGEMVNSPASHAGIHGFEPHTRHQKTESFDPVFFICQKGRCSLFPVQQKAPKAFLPVLGNE